MVDILGERSILEVKKRLSFARLHLLKKVNIEEYEFWDTLKNQCLLPQSTAYGLEDDLKGNTIEYFNKCCKSQLIMSSVGSAFVSKAFAINRGTNRY